MKKTIFLTVVLLLATGGLAQAQEGELHGTTGVTLDSRYVWRGITVFGSKGGLHPFVDLDLFGTGFGLNVTGHVPMGTNPAGPLGVSPINVGLQELERWDYTPYYAGLFGKDEKWETRYKIGYTYFNYPDTTSHSSFKSLTNVGSYDLQEMFAAGAMPNLLGVEGLVPAYAFIKGWPSNSGTLTGSVNPNRGSYSGSAHVFMLDYGVPVKDLLPEIPEQVIKLHGEMVYNDQIDPRPAGPQKDSDWTHFVLGVSTDFDLGNEWYFTPAIYYQHTMDENINDDPDVLWSGFTLAYKF
ncbi:MAG: hypothetical protein ACYTEL_23105 [Planctomycetota bacterium]|jgi:hypothetical protein